MLYKVTVRSVVDFALPVYYHSLKMSDKNKLEQIQYKGAKLASGALHGSSMIKLPEFRITPVKSGFNTVRFTLRFT